MESYRIILETSSQKVSQSCVNILEQHNILAVTTYNTDSLRTRLLNIKVMVSEHNFQRALQLVGMWQNTSPHESH